ncbi:MAG: hypothetical protein QM752_06205 [Gammaproteobacteria bacterium]
MENQERNLFLLQTEFIDNKVEMGVSKAISQVVDLIVNLKTEMHREIGGLRQEMHREIGGLRHEMHREIGGLRQEMHDLKSEVGERLTAVETALGMRNQVRGELRTRFFDYTFRAGWAIGLVVLSAAVSSLVVVLHSIV